MKRNIKKTFDPNDHILLDLMAKRDQAHQIVLLIRSTRSAVHAYKDACRILQKYTRARKSEWWEMKAGELQRAADRNDMKGFYSGLQEVRGPQTKQSVHLKSSDGLEIFTDSKNVMARWSEYFQKLLNVPGDIEPEVLECIQKRSVNAALDEKSTMDEMVRAIKGLKDGKAPGGDGIPAEVWKYGGANLSNRLHRWIMNVWEEGHVPQAWKDANIVIIYKKKETKENLVITEIYIFFLQPARSLLGSY